MKTKYRRISDGTWDWLQCLNENRKILFIFRKPKWEYVWKPYYNWIQGRGIDDANLLVNSHKDNIKDFVEQWPNIDDYFKNAIVIQNKLEKEAAEKNAVWESRRNKITYIEN